MTRDEALLEQTSAWRPTGPGPHILRANLPGGTVATLTAERIDDLGCQLSELSVSTGEPAACTAADLTERAMQTAGRVTGLLEPLKVYEVDADRSVALLRSEKPTVRRGTVHYFEVTLNGLHLAGLKRYKVDQSGGRRDAVPFVLTHEAVAKVVGDLIGP